MFYVGRRGRGSTDVTSGIHMNERPPTDADGRMDPMVPELPTRRVQPDGGQAHGDTLGTEEVRAEADAPLVPDCS
jgi:hypothetical protein